MFYVQGDHIFNENLGYILNRCRAGMGERLVDLYVEN
jgi:hypothetical protein